jgi:hypothetical protein
MKPTEEATIELVSHTGGEAEARGQMQCFPSGTCSPDTSCYPEYCDPKYSICNPKCSPDTCSPNCNPNVAGCDPDMCSPRYCSPTCKPSYR